jgi:hypothetical protein
MAMPHEYEELNAVNRYEGELEVFKVVSEHFRNDFKMVWEHSNFFFLVEGALLTVFASLSGRKNQEDVVSALAYIGLATSVLWWWAAASRMYLVDEWRAQMVKVDDRVDPLRVFCDIEEPFTRAGCSTPRGSSRGSSRRSSS